MNDASSATARALEALADCDRRFFRAVVGLRERRPEVVEVRRDVTLRVLDGGGARAELGVEALLTDDERAAYWQIGAEWTEAGWTLAAHAYVSVRGQAVELRPTERWTGTAAAAFAEVASGAAADLVANMAVADLVGPAPALAAAAERLEEPESGPPVLLGVPRADLVRAYVLDGMAEEDAEQFVAALLNGGGTHPGPGHARTYYGIEELVPVARLGPPLSDALRARLERTIANTEAALDTLRALLARVRDITPRGGE